MRLDLKTPWFTKLQTDENDQAQEFINIRDNWNSHDSGYSPWTMLSSIGSLTTGIVQKTAAYTVALNDQIIFVNSTAGAVAVTLLSAIGLDGRRYTVKDWKGQAAANNITVGTSLSQTIDGAATKVLNVAYQSFTFVSDGANWSII